MAGLILHHYDFSNFAEKARLMLGFKGLAWRSVEQPPILPKPKLLPLTGGYRRIPILQDGADLWCDTRLIAQELERRVPSPTLVPDGTHGHGEAIAWWAEHQFMRPSALFVSGINAESANQDNNDVNPDAIYHVALWAGNGQIMEASKPGDPLRTISMRWGNTMPFAGRP